MTKATPMVVSQKTLLDDYPTKCKKCAKLERAYHTISFDGEEVERPYIKAFFAPTCPNCGRYP